MIRTACIALVLALLLIAPTPAKAFWGYPGYAYGYGVGYGYPGGWNNDFPSNNGLDFVPPPPYYSVYPPVYYSPFITKRHYGASPYAWLPGMSPITYLPPRGPTIMRNPNAGNSKPLDSKVASSASKPLLIENPFVQLPEKSAPIAIAPAEPILNPYLVSAQN
jgi:hypothetical protein